MSTERKTKIALLKRKSRRQYLLKELNFLNLTEASLLDTENNELFCKSVFSFLNKQKNKIRLQGTDYKEQIQLSIHMINETLHPTDVTTKKGRLLFFREHEIEAVLINANEVVPHLDKLIELTTFSTGYGDFILVAEDFHFGLCIERKEYFYEFSTWGILDNETS